MFFLELHQLNEKYKPEKMSLKRFREIGFILSVCHPTFCHATEEYFKLTGKYIPFSDMYRTPLRSYKATQRKNNVARAGNSGHNFGISVDVDLKQIFKDLQLKGGWASKLKHVQELFAKSGLEYIVRADGKNEAHHFNLFEDFSYGDPDRALFSMNRAGVSRKFFEYYAMHSTNYDALQVGDTKALQHTINSNLEFLTFEKAPLKTDGIQGKKTNTLIYSIAKKYGINDINIEHFRRLIISIDLQRRAGL